MKYDFQHLIAEAKEILDKKDKAREEALKLSREITRNSAFSTRALHQEEPSEAEKLLGEARERHKELLSVLEGHPDLRYSGFVHDAEKELVEASVILSIKKKKPIKKQKELGVLYTAYLNGIGEAMGEVRRMLLDCIRKGELDECEELLSLMEEVYYFLSSLLYPDAITGNLRRTVDMVRGVLERSRGDLTLAMVTLPLREDNLKEEEGGEENA
jgi:translin